MKCSLIFSTPDKLIYAIPVIIVIGVVDKSEHDINGFSNNRTNFLIDWQAFAAKHGSFLRSVWENIWPSNIMKNIILYNKFCFSCTYVLFKWLFY